MQVSIEGVNGMVINKNISLLLIIIIFYSCSSNKYSKNNNIIIPFTLENNRIVINATVNGIEGRYFWDTGSFDSITTASLVNLPIVEDESRPYTKYFIKDRISINNQIIKTESTIYNPSVDVPRSEVIQQILQEEKFDGLLGFSIFNGYWCELSFSESKIILYNNRPKRFSKSIRGVIQGSTLYNIFEIDNVYLYILVDTGSTNAFLFPHTFMNHLGTDDYSEILTDEPGKKYMIRTGLINLFDDVFIDKFILTSDKNPIDGVVITGVEYLQYYDLLFDFTDWNSGFAPASLYYMSRFPDIDKNTLSFSDLLNNRLLFGIFYITTEHGVYINGISKESIAYNEYNLAPGMTITHVNGISLNTLTDEEKNKVIVSLVDNDNGELTVFDANNQRHSIKRQKIR
jgi:predicted aspartyl protease